LFSLMTARVCVLEPLLNLECITLSFGIAAEFGRNPCTYAHIPRFKADRYFAATARIPALSFSLDPGSLACGSPTHEGGSTA